MTHKRLQKDLLLKMGVQQSALSKRAAKVKRALPMTTDEAVYVLAQLSGLQLDRYLDGDTLSRAREVFRQYSTVAQGVTNSAVDGSAHKNKSSKEIRTVVVSGEFKRRSPRRQEWQPVRCHTYG